MAMSSSRLLGACSSSLNLSCSQRPSSFHNFLFRFFGLPTQRRSSYDFSKGRSVVVKRTSGTSPPPERAPERRVRRTDPSWGCKPGFSCPHHRPASVQLFLRPSFLGHRWIPVKNQIVSMFTQLLRLRSSGGNSRHSGCPRSSSGSYSRVLARQHQRLSPDHRRSAALQPGCPSPQACSPLYSDCLLPSPLPPLLWPGCWQLLGWNHWWLEEPLHHCSALLALPPPLPEETMADKSLKTRRRLYNSSPNGLT